MMELRELIDKLRRNRRLEHYEYRELLAGLNPQLLEYAAANAREVTMGVFGNGIYVRALIELTNYCRNDCYYCGIRHGNRALERYRLTKEQVLDCARMGDLLGLRTFVIQGGEDPTLRERDIVDIVSAIRNEFPDAAITLSLGEWKKEAYQAFYDAGANRYLLRHETANRLHYSHLHPSWMSYDRRIECLHNLKDIGFQIGTGIMVGSPEQTLDNLVEDILFIERLEPHMVGMGPYLPQHNTPFAHERAGSIDMTLLILSIFRLMFPKALIPSTTALASITADGRQRGILAGCNVVMPNISPPVNRSKYSLYDNKRAFGLEAVEGLNGLERLLRSIGYHISYARGDYAG